MGKPRRLTTMEAKEAILRNIDPNPDASAHQLYIRHITA